MSRHNDGEVRVFICVSGNDSYTMGGAGGSSVPVGPPGPAFGPCAEAIQCEECRHWIIKAERPYHTCDPDDWYAELAVRMKDIAPA